MFVRLVQGDNSRSSRVRPHRLVPFFALVLIACGGNGGDAVLVGSGGDGGSDPSLGPADASAHSDAAPDARVVVHPGDGTGDAGCGVVKAETQPQKGAVDVVWVVDDSGSMLPQVLPVGDNMARFMDGVRKSGGDISVVMVTGPIIGTYLAGTISDTNYHWVTLPVQSHDAFDWALNGYSGYTQYLRPDAALHFVFVSDDSADMSAADFLSRMQGTVHKPFTVHAVAADGLSGSCLGSPPFLGGKDYTAAANTTGGEQLSLCGDWGAGFDKLESSVAASVPLPCEYAIPAPPDGQTLDPEAVQVLYTASGANTVEFARAVDASKCADNVAWHFDVPDAPTRVQMCAQACDAVKAGGAIELGFGCAPSVILR